MKKQINEIKRMQQLAGLIKESQLNETEETISFGEFKNVGYHQRNDNKIFLTVTESDNFREIENNYEFEGSDAFTEEEREYFNEKISELAEGMSEYLSNMGIENEIYDDQIGYGQEIDNLVVAISKEDLAKLM
jgi:hypothetical protein